MAAVAAAKDQNRKRVSVIQNNIHTHILDKLCALSVMAHIWR